MVGGTNGGICHGLLNLIFIFHLVKLCFESGLRTIQSFFKSTKVYLRIQNQ